MCWKQACRCYHTSAGVSHTYVCDWLTQAAHDCGWISWSRQLMTGLWMLVLHQAYGGLNSIALNLPVGCDSDWFSFVDHSCLPSDRVDACQSISITTQNNRRGPLYISLLHVIRCLLWLLWLQLPLSPLLLPLTLFLLCIIAVGLNLLV